MTGESLGEEEVVAGPIYVRDGGVAQGVNRVHPVEPGDPLPVLEGGLEPALREALAGLVAEQGGVRGHGLPRDQLVAPEPLQLRQEGIREEDVADAAALGDLTAQADPGSRPAVRGEHIPDIQADDFRQA